MSTHARALLIIVVSTFGILLTSTGAWTAQTPRLRGFTIGALIVFTCSLLASFALLIKVTNP